MEALSGNAAELAEFSSDGFRPKVLLETPSMKVLLAAFEPGQSIPLHSPNVDVAMSVLSGVGEVAIGDEVFHVQAGDIAVAPAGVRRGIRAGAARLVLLNVASPPPTDDDHAGESEPWGEVSPLDTSLGDSMHEEHLELLEHIDHLRDAAAQEYATADDLRTALKAIGGFLSGSLGPHAKAEEIAAYPAVDKVLRAVGGGTKTMSVDHEFIEAYAGQLAALARSELGPAESEEARRVLLVLEGILRLHFEKEERIYNPALALLSPREKSELKATLDSLPGHDQGHAH